LSPSVPLLGEGAPEPRGKGVAQWQSAPSSILLPTSGRRRMPIEDTLFILNALLAISVLFNIACCMILRDK